MQSAFFSSTTNQTNETLIFVKLSITQFQLSPLPPYLREEIEVFEIVWGAGKLL